MHLSQPALEGKPQRACTPAIHRSITENEALFHSLTTPGGFQSDGDGGQLELGTCRNCGSTIARQVSEAQLTLKNLGLGDVR